MNPEEKETPLFLDKVLKVPLRLNLMSPSHLMHATTSLCLLHLFFILTTLTLVHFMKAMRGIDQKVEWILQLYARADRRTDGQSNM